MQYDRELRDKIVEEYKSTLKSQGLRHGNRYMGLLEIVLDKNLGLAEKQDKPFDPDLLYSLQLEGKAAGHIETELGRSFRGVITDAHVLEFYQEASQNRLPRIGKKSAELLRRYLIKRGLLEDIS